MGHKAVADIPKKDWLSTATCIGVAFRSGFLLALLAIGTDDSQWILFAKKN